MFAFNFVFLFLLNDWLERVAVPWLIGLTLKFGSSWICVYKLCASSKAFAEVFLVKFIKSVCIDYCLSTKSSMSSLACLLNPPSGAFPADKCHSQCMSLL